jgi:glycosyltransferase involved in cell wall biosynthesis
MSTHEKITLFFDNPLIGQVLDPESFDVFRFGGVEVQMAYLIKELLKTRLYHVVVITAQPFSYPGIEIRSPLRSVTGKIPLVFRLVNANRKRMLFSAETKQRILFQSYLENSNNTDAALEAGVRTVFWVNGDSLVDDSDILPKYYRRRLELCLPKFDTVICQSPYQKRLLRDTWGINSPIVETGSQPIEIDADKSTLLWVGRCVPLKQPELFLEIARRFQDVSCHMIMTTPNVTDTSFAEQIIDDAKGINNLTIEINVPHAEMPSRYAQALAFVSTSTTEGAPNVFIEAGMAAAPVFSLQVNPAHMLDDEKLGLCANGDLELLIELIRDYLALPPAEQQKRQCAAKDAALSRWGIDQMVASYREVFELESNHLS